MSDVSRRLAARAPARFLALACLLASAQGLFAAGAKEGAAQASASFVTDAVGRSVPVPASLDGGIVTVGSSGPLRFLSIFDVFDKVVQVDKGDVTDNKNGRGYSYAYAYDAFGPERYHPDSKLEAETVEKIGARNPSLIIVQQSVYESYRDNCELLASRFPLLVLPAQSMTELWDADYRLAPWYTASVRSLGAVLRREPRAEEHIAAVEAIMADIRSLAKPGSAAPAKRVYVAGLTWQGSNELTTTFPTYLPLMLVGGVNAHGGSEASRVVMDVEAITKIPMDYFVIDPSSSDKLATPNSQLILEWLHKRNNDGDPTNDVRLFVTLPMVWDSANYDCVLAGAYYLSSILYGAPSEATLMAKIDGVFRAYYGERGAAVYPGMKAFFAGKSAANGVELPLLKEVRVTLSGGTYGLAAR